MLSTPPIAFKLAFLSLVLGLLASCASVAYYGQAARGQLGLMWGRQSISSLLADETLDPVQREKLELVLAARSFATQQLQLPADNSYLSYVALDRPYVLWNVFAAPEFSTQPVNWCYPIAGCVSYRGYFAEAAAQRYATQLAAQGLDVYSGGVDAYSTLGWFKDPLTSAVLRRPEHRLVGLIFHELAHQLLYVPGATSFNESFASFVEQEGLRRWYARYPQDGVVPLVTQQQRVEAEFVALVLDYRERLTALYGQALSVAAMRTAKQEIQEQLRAEYSRRKVLWGYDGYDLWFAGPLNNAQLATVASYNELVPAFAALLAQEQGDLARFYELVKGIAHASPEAPAALLLRQTRL